MLPVQYQDEGCRKVGHRLIGMSIEECYRRAVEKFGEERMSGVVYYKLESGFADQDFNDSLNFSGSNAREICVSFWEIA